MAENYEIRTIEAVHLDGTVNAEDTITLRHNADWDTVEFRLDEKWGENEGAGELWLDEERLLRLASACFYMWERVRNRNHDRPS